MSKLIQGSNTLNLSILEQIKVSGGDPIFHFFEPLKGLPKPIKLGNEPRQWKFDVSLNHDDLETLREMYESGAVCDFVIPHDDGMTESYRVVIRDMDFTDKYEIFEVSLTLQEVDIEETIEVG